MFCYEDSSGICACIATGLLFAMSGANCGGNGFVPVVPYSSYDEFEEMLEGLIVAYDRMVSRAVNPQCVMGWCRLWKGIDPCVEIDWLRDGYELFLQFTKGLGDDWCDTMNTMVVHALCTAVRVMIQTCSMMGGVDMDGDYDDQAQIRGLLKCETRRAIADRDRSPNNMSSFEDRNFNKIWKDDDIDYYDMIPVAQWHEMQLSFCMMNHERLGSGAAGKGLGCDMIRVILAKVLE